MLKLTFVVKDFVLTELHLTSKYTKKGKKYFILNFE